MLHGNLYMFSTERNLYKNSLFSLVHNATVYQFFF